MGIQGSSLAQHRHRRQVTQSNLRNDAVKISLPETNSDLFHNWNLTIACSVSCVLQMNLSLIANSFQKNPVIHFKNMWFSNSRIGLGNVHVVFWNVIFLNTLITDQVQTDHELHHVTLQFSSCKFESQFPESNAFVLSLTNTLSVAITITESELVNAQSQINIPQLYYKSRDTWYNSSELVFSSDVFRFCTFQNVVLSGSGVSDESLAEIVSIRLKLDFTNCVLVGGAGGLKLRKPDPGLLESWMKVGIKNCTFQNNIKLGSGGALSIEYFPQDLGFTDPGSFVKIKDCTFGTNEVDRTGPVILQGGAISIYSLTSGTHCQKLSVEVENNIFEDNKATDGGGSIWISNGCLETFVSNSTFQITNQIFDSPKGVFILGYSEISISDSVFTREIKQSSPSLLELQILSQTGEI